MKNKRSKLILSITVLATILMFILTGCTVNGKPVLSKQEQVPEVEHFKTIEKYKNNYICYDEHTKVKYIYNMYHFTMLTDSEGKPLLHEK